MYYEWESPAPGVHRCRLPFLDVTVGLVHGRDGVVLIDCGTTLLEAAQLSSDIADITGAAVTHIVMTHHHFDHILGAPGFGGAISYAPPAVARALTTGIGEVRAHALQYGADAGELDRAIAAARAPDHVITEVDLDLGDRTIRVEHPGRGHTDHDLVVVVAPVGAQHRTVVFCGDLVEESADPAINAESDVRAWIGTLDRLLALGGPDAIYIPGHGAAVDAAFVARQRDWLTTRS
ncbi:MBL fold metallo-hydrolase [Mycobacterium sp. DL592]|uniref:MBL fold metallo-hydrolase n=1 Tax=Mycobacterium sp. DL592 TaxID=2675524 RepID=UPI0014227342|nr:MBL fold metallo-hydrolase [Mycobacterium sp. DL592]